MKWFTAIMQFLAALADYYRNGQLLEAGKQQERSYVHEANNKARKTAKQVKAGINDISGAELDKLRGKYTRKK